VPDSAEVVKTPTLKKVHVIMSRQSNIKVKKSLQTSITIALPHKYMQVSMIDEFGERYTIYLVSKRRQAT
jgi:hypothetical protein